MSQNTDSDHYETLQVSPRADLDTIERVFRHLAKRFHPDNADTGNAERFNRLVEAYRNLSDPELRAAYDARYSEVQSQQWQIFDQTSATDNVEGDRRLRLALMTILYQARRTDVTHPGVGILKLERVLDCPRDHMEFHIWYLKETGWIERLDTGLLAITVEGVNHLATERLPWSGEERRLRAGPAVGDVRTAHGGGGVGTAAPGAEGSARTAPSDEGSARTAPGTEGPGPAAAGEAGSSASEDEGAESATPEAAEDGSAAARTAGDDTAGGRREGDGTAWESIL